MVSFADELCPFLSWCFLPWIQPCIFTTLFISLLPSFFKKRSFKQFFPICELVEYVLSVVATCSWAFSSCNSKYVLYAIQNLCGSRRHLPSPAVKSSQMVKPLEPQCFLFVCSESVKWSNSSITSSLCELMWPRIQSVSLVVSGWCEVVFISVLMGTTASLSFL